MRRLVLLLLLAALAALALVPRAGWARLAAPGLAWAMAQSRDRAAEDAQPMPAVVRARLAGFFPEEVLDRVRHRVGPVAPLPAVVFQGEAIAITLGDVIVFRDASQAVTDAGLWAHELQHVRQIEALGLDGFARAYLTDWGALEREALRTTSEFTLWEAVQAAKRRRS